MERVMVLYALHPQVKISLRFNAAVPPSIAPVV